METTAKTFSWNVVTQDVQADAYLQKKLQQKIRKLERHLQRFPPDAVHLQIILKRWPRKPLFTAALTLRVPHDILRSEKSAPDLIAAFDNAVEALLRELEKFKGRLRREPEWKRKERREQLHVGFAPVAMAAGSGPQNLRDVVASLLQQEETSLLRHVRRLIRQEELSGELPPGALDARAIVDEVARQSLAAPADKPDAQSYRVWLYSLARAEFQRRLRAWRQEQRERVPVGPEPALPDTQQVAPDAEVARREWLEHLQRVAKDWPAAERAVLDLYFIEGFEREEVALLLKRPVAEVDKLIGAVQTRLRWELAHES